MRVSCETVDDFLECLEDLAKKESAAFENAVRVSVVRNPCEGENKRKAVRFEVFFHASAVVQLKDGESEYLLEAAEFCGIDYHDAEPETKGTQKADLLRERMKKFCKEVNLSVLPGIIDL